MDTFKVKIEKTTLNQLVVNDHFKWLGGNSPTFKVVKIVDSIIYYTSNGKEYNCRYDEGRCNKIIKI
jgi:hypothetical protein